jgi:hypothetical protein
MIARVLTIIALTGSVAWLIQNPSWEPAVTSVALLATFAGIEVARRRGNSLEPVTSSDQALFDKFLEEFPSNGRSAQFLMRHAAGVPIEPTDLEHIEAFLARWDNAEHEFHSRALEKRRLRLYGLLIALQSSLQLDVGPPDNSTYSQIGRTLAAKTWQEVYSRRSEVNKLKQLAYAAHQDLVRTGRRLFRDA